MQIIAHRCGTDRYPELTVDAALYSLQAGAAYAEADVRFTSDQVAVISHDPTAERLFGCAKCIGSMDAASFCALRYKDGSNYAGTTLEAFLQGGAKRLLLHIKEGSGEHLARIYEICKAYGAETSVCYGVESPADAAYLKALSPSLLVLAFQPEPGNAEAFAGAGADILRLWDAWATQKSIASVHALHCQCWIMANGERLGYASRARLAQLKAWGADGVLVNEAERTILERTSTNSVHN